MKRILGKTSKPFALLATILILATVGTGSTLAWLMTSSEKVENSFVVPEVTPTIKEGFKPGGSVKSNVMVENTVGTGKTGMDVYIRVALVPTWETADGNVAPVSASLDDLNIAWGSNWLNHSDGYYYYTGKVVPGGNTSNLIESATVRADSAGAKAGYRMNLQVMAEAIQATESVFMDKEKNAWPAAVWNSLQHE